jgi:mono/diheme cytochrome c family protein
MYEAEYRSKLMTPVRRSAAYSGRCHVLEGRFAQPTRIGSRGWRCVSSRKEVLAQASSRSVGLYRKETVLQGAANPRRLAKYEMPATSIGFLRRGVSAWIVALFVFGASAMNIWAATSGKQDFEQNCASCHGKDGMGHGEALYVIPGIKPPDLTKLSRNNRGVFPAEEVYQSIDGRAGIPGHSRLDMPFWGTVFQEGGKEFTPESEAKAKERISNIVSYIQSIQQK